MLPKCRGSLDLIKLESSRIWSAAGLMVMDQHPFPGLDALALCETFHCDYHCGKVGEVTRNAELVLQLIFFFIVVRMELRAWTLTYNPSHLPF